MGIVCYQGVWGSGKSLALTRFGLDGLAEGREIYNNYGCYFGEAFTTFDELVTVIATADRRRPRRLLVDELGAILPSDESPRLSPALRLLLTNGRKFGFDVGYTTQDFSMVQRKMRLVTTDVVSCRGLSWPKVKLPPDADGIPQDPRPMFFSQAWYRVHGGDRAPMPYWRRIWTLDKEAATSYDTFGLIANLQKLLLDEQKRADNSIPLHRQGVSEAV